MHHDQQALTRGMTNGYETALADRMIRIVEGRSQRVVKDRDRLIE